MKTRDFALSFGLVAGLFATNMAFAQNRPPCADREIVVDRLTSGYGETVRSMGLGANNGMVEIYCLSGNGHLDHHGHNAERNDLPSGIRTGIRKSEGRIAC